MGNLPSALDPQRTTTTGQPVLLKMPVYGQPPSAPPPPPPPPAVASPSMGWAALAFPGQMNTSYAVIHSSIRDLPSSCCSQASASWGEVSGLAFFIDSLRRGEMFFVPQRSASR